MSKRKWIVFLFFLLNVMMAVILYLQFNYTINDKDNEIKETKENIVDTENETIIDEVDLNEQIPTFKVIDKISNNMDLINIKNKAKDELKKYADDKNISNIYKNELDLILNNSFEQIDNSNNQKEIDQVVEDGKKKINKLKNQEELNTLKDQLILQLKEYYNSLDFLDKNEIDSVSQIALNEEILLIKNSIIKEEVLKNYTFAKNRLYNFKLQENLNLFKKKSIEELINYYDNLNFLDKDETHSTSKEKLNIGTINITINNHIEEIKIIVTDTKNELQKLKDIEQLKQYSDSLNFNNDFILIASDIVNEGIGEINNELTDALNIYQKKLDELKKEQNLEEYKTKKINDLIREKDHMNFSNNYLLRANDIVNNGTNAINNGITISFVDNQYSIYLEKLRKLKEEENYQSLSKFNIAFGSYEETKYTTTYKEVCIKFIGCKTVEILEWSKVSYPKVIIKGINTNIWGFIPNLDIVSVKYDNNEIYNDYYLWKNSDVDENKDITDVKLITIKYMILGDGIFAGTYETKYEILKNELDNRYVILKSNIKL